MPIQNYLIQWILIQLQVSFENQITIMAPSIGFKQHAMIAARQETRNEPQDSIGTKISSKNHFDFFKWNVVFLDKFQPICANSLKASGHLLQPLAIVIVLLGMLGGWANLLGHKMLDTDWRRSQFFLEKTKWWSAAFWLEELFWIDHKWSCLNINMCQWILSNLNWSQAWRRWKAERDPSSPASFVPSCQVE